MTKKILVFAGSARQGSVNKKLAAVLAEETRKRGAEVSLIDLAAYPAPLYNGDLEAAEGLPQSMRAFKGLVVSHDALLIVTPEYNGHVPPLLFNTLSWASRPEGDEAGAAAFRGKTTAIAAASPGRLGGVRVLPRLRDYLAELGAVTIPGFMTLPGAFQAFDDKGGLLDEAADAAAKDLARRLVAAAQSGSGAHRIARTALSRRFESKSSSQVIPPDRDLL